MRLGNLRSELAERLNICSPDLILTGAIVTFQMKGGKRPFFWKVAIAPFFIFKDM